MIYGYCRVSTRKQLDGNSLEQQKQEILSKYSNAVITQEQYTGTKADRPLFTELLDKLFKGDMLVVTKLDRLARNTVEGIQIVQSLFDKGVSVHVLNVGLLENTTMGKFFLTTLLAVAEMERNTILERTQAGKEIAKQNPNFREGRPKKFKNGLMELAIQEFESGQSTYADIDNKYGISKSTLYRAMKKRQAEQIGVIGQSQVTQSSDGNNVAHQANTKLHKITERANALGLTVTTYDEDVENVPHKHLDEVLNQLEFGSGDVLVSIRRKQYVLEVVIDDNELDLHLLSRDEYKNKYGRDLYDEEHYS